MKRALIYLISVLVLTACGSPGAVQAAGVIGTAGPTATRTVTPSPTVGWQATAVAAQATADEARRIDTAATAAEKERVQEQLGWTAQADIRTAQSSDATATAYGTSVPLTGTARAEDMTAMNAYMTLSAGQLTATHEAPTQAAAMVQVGYERRFGWVNYVAMGCLAFLFFGLGVFALGRSRGGGEPMVTHQQTVREEPEIIVPVKETVVNVKTATGQGWGRDRLMRVPCSPEQLTELAERVIMQNESLGVNNFEGAKSLLTRAVILQVRHFMQSNELASSIRAGRVELTEDGRAFLRGWLEKHSLPHSFEFDGEDGQKPGVMSHEHEAHVSAHGGGV
jgi:hypothetical protein